MDQMQFGEFSGATGAKCGYASKHVVDHIRNFKAGGGSPRSRRAQPEYELPRHHRIPHTDPNNPYSPRQVNSKPEMKKPRKKISLKALARAMNTVSSLPPAVRARKRSVVRIEAAQREQARKQRLRDKELADKHAERHHQRAKANDKEVPVENERHRKVKEKHSSVDNYRQKVLEDAHAAEANKYHAEKDEHLAKTRKNLSDVPAGVDHNSTYTRVTRGPGGTVHRFR